MHRLMGLPATMAIQSISAATLSIKVPWRHLKTEPMTVSMEEVVVRITELPAAGPPDKSIPKLDRIMKMMFATPLSFSLSHNSSIFPILLLSRICMVNTTEMQGTAVEASRWWRRSGLCGGCWRTSACRLWTCG